VSAADEAGRNPYAPPKASLERAPGDEKAVFFTASPLKFVVMSVFTLNFYPLYWFYRNFKVIKERDDNKSMPFWRAFFAPFWAFVCFREIATAAAGGSYGQRTGAANGLGAAYFFLNAISRLPDPWGWLSLGAFLTFLPPNGWARAYNLTVEPDLPENSRFTAANIAWMIFGGLFWAAIVIGLTQPAA